MSVIAPVDAIHPNEGDYAGSFKKAVETRTTLPGRHSQEMAQLVQRLISQSRTLRRREEANWYVDMRYLAGDQWVVWDPRYRTLSVRPKKPWRIRQTINHLRPNAEVMLNVLTGRRIRMDATPTDGSIDARLKARVGRKLFRSLWQELEIDEELDAVLLDNIVTGRGFLFVGWNPQGGDTVSLPDYGQLPEGVLPGPGYDLPMQQVQTGQITTEYINPLSMHVDPAATSINKRKARWAGHETYMHIEEARNRWDKAKDVTPDSGQDVWFNYQRRLLFEQGGHATSEDLADTVTVRTMFFRPDGKNPDGRKVVTVGNTVVEDVDNPTPGGEYPYVDFLCYRNPGSYWGQGATNLARNAQTSANRFRSIYMEMLTKVGIPQWAIARGAGVNRTAITDEAGLVVYYNPGIPNAVKKIEGSQPPPGWERLMDRDIGDIRELMGAQDVLRGVNPSGSRSGRMQAYMIEQNMGRHGPLVERYKRSLTRLGNLWLGYAKKFYDEDRWMQITGEDNRVEAFVVDREALEYMSGVKVDVGPTAPETRSQRRENVRDLYRDGLIVDRANQPSPSRAMKLLDEPIDDDLYDSDADDLAWAMEENERMAAGEQLQPELHDNHETHGDTHVAFMRTARYRDLGDQTKQVIRQHLQFHIQVLETNAAPTNDPRSPGNDGGAGGLDTEPRQDLRGGPT